MNIMESPARNMIGYIPPIHNDSTIFSNLSLQLYHLYSDRGQHCNRRNDSCNFRCPKFWRYLLPIDDINKKITELSIDYPIGLADEAAYGEINKLSPSIPFTIVVDSNGKPIDDLVVGAYPADEWKTMFDKWLSSVN